ncbi:MAG: T9SS type A sorting domain-containing protein [Bacteroidales bacterium]|nr:T9SS type A sorting domain-containing protein [Bacteroidales bacterium]
MKKAIFLLFIAIIFNFDTKSQTLELYNNNNELLNYGDTLTILGDVQITELKIIVKIKNTLTSDVQVTCHKQYITLVEGTTNTFCWDNSCYPPHVFNAPAMTIQANTTTDKFSAEYYPNGIAGESIIKYTFKVVNGDSAWIFVKFSISTNINYYTLYHFNIYPNPATDYLMIHAPINSIIRFYSLEGILIKTINLQQENAQISIQELKKDCFYILEITKNKITKRWKIFLQKK